ncbi:MAG: heavy metal translocating P-type ATPase [Eubacterium sp.]|nr:heavy metal translocating P-type ATPase [Eubacterium sp.]
MDTKTINIKGMSCASCAAALEKSLSKLNGVSTASVNFASEKALIVYDPRVIRLPYLREAIEKAGYVIAEEKKIEDNQTDRRKEIRKMWTKFIISAVFTFPLLYIAMVPMINFFNLPFSSELHHIMERRPLTYALIELLLIIPVIGAGNKFYTAGFKAFLRLSPNMDSLIAMGTTAAALYSFYNVWQIAKGNLEAVESLYFECAAVIITLILLGETLETIAKGKTGEAIKKLMGLTPKTAFIIIEGKEKEIPVEDVKVGDIISVKPGSKIPVDGTVTYGHTSIDESMLTGESIPVDKAEGSKVYAASINTTGTIQFRAEKVGSVTMLAQIIKLVEDAQSSKAPIAKLADIVSGYFVPAVCTVAFVAGIIWLLITGGDIKHSLTIFISVLVIACPCALGLATPCAIMVGTGKGAENGILIKSGLALETTHKINAIVFDKTGTITEGRPSVTDVIPIGAMEQNYLLRLAASAEAGSEHPLGLAVVMDALNKGLEFFSTRDFNSLTGLGIEAYSDGKKIIAGNRRLMDERGISLAELEAVSNKLADEGKTPIYVAVDGKPAGIVAVSDIIKPSSKKAIEILHNMGIEVNMITGDNKKTANAIAGQIGIDRVLADVLPKDKADEVKKLQARGIKVAMVGDGINDAPALAQADVGIAIGSGTDVAMEAADIVLMRSDLSDVTTAINLSRATIKNIKQNLFWAFGYNTLGIPIAALGLLNPMIAAAAMCFSDISLLLNVLRLKKYKL